MNRADDKNMYTATKEILKILDSQGLIYKHEHFELSDNDGADYDCISIKFNTEHISALNMELLITNNQFVSIKTFSICRVRNEKLISVLKLVNYINSIFSYVKFFIDEGNTLCAEADCSMLPSDTDFSVRVMDFISLYIDILNSTYPQIMECIWSRK